MNIRSLDFEAELSAILAQEIQNEIDAEVIHHINRERYREIENILKEVVQKQTKTLE